MIELTEKKYSSLQHACFVFSVLSLLAGVGGMVLSFYFLASSSMEDIAAGTSGFVAGSVFIGVSLICLTLLNLRSRQ